jgi:hypothetical protein
MQYSSEPLVIFIYKSLFHMGVTNFVMQQEKGIMENEKCKMKNGVR